MVRYCPTPTPTSLPRRPGQNGQSNKERHLGQWLDTEKPDSKTLKCSGVPPHHISTAYAKCRDFVEQQLLGPPAVLRERLHVQQRPGRAPGFDLAQAFRPGSEMRDALLRFRRQNGMGGGRWGVF